jgi:hypothetical protein
VIRSLANKREFILLSFIQKLLKFFYHFLMDLLNDSLHLQRRHLFSTVAAPLKPAKFTVLSAKYKFDL